MILAEQVAGTVDWWARGVGGAAIIVSSAALAWNVYNAVWRDRARLKISVNPGVMGEPFGGGSVSYLGIEAANVGRRPITLTGMGFQFATKHHISDPVAGEFPLELNEGQSHTKRFKLPKLKLAIKQSPAIGEAKLAWVRDATGILHTKKLSQANKTFLVNKKKEQPQ